MATSGLRQQLYPWKKRASMVVEIQTQAGDCMSFMYDRLPSQLDDAIKGVNAEFYFASKNIAADELKDELPMAFPMTNNYPEFPCIAKYPVDAWEEAGAP
eukprot:4973728-Lingulodinium_polyedra.AAC.1